MIDGRGTGRGDRKVEQGEHSDHGPEAGSDGASGDAPSTTRPGRRVGLGALVAVAVVALVAGGLVGGLLAGGDDPSAPEAEVLAATTSVVSGGHRHGVTSDEERATIVEFGGDERAALAEQLLTVREVALRYPTYADALAAGYVPTTPYAPGTGSHVGKPADAQPSGTPLDLQRPQSYLYDGTEPDSRVVGVMYVQIGGEERPDGFVGPLDLWSMTRGQCLEQGSMDPAFPAAESVTEEMCDSVDGQFVDVIAWTQHAWVVPGWEAPGGVFADLNDDIVCADGTTDADPVEGCTAPTHTGASE